MKKALTVLLLIIVLAAPVVSHAQGAQMVSVPQSTLTFFLEKLKDLSSQVAELKSQKCAATAPVSAKKQTIEELAQDSLKPLEEQLTAIKNERAELSVKIEKNLCKGDLGAQTSYTYLYCRPILDKNSKLGADLLALQKKITALKSLQ